jgi:hypothetical protein
MIAIQTMGSVRKWVTRPTILALKTLLAMKRHANLPKETCLVESVDFPKWMCLDSFERGTTGDSSQPIHFCSDANVSNFFLRQEPTAYSSKEESFACVRTATLEGLLRPKAVF